MLKRRLSKLEQDYKKKGQDRVLVVFQDKKRNKMKIPELDFLGTIADGKELLSRNQDHDLVIYFNVPRPD
jgi:hypothetical protein